MRLKIIGVWQTLSYLKIMDVKLRIIEFYSNAFKVTTKKA